MSFIKSVRLAWSYWRSLRRNTSVVRLHNTVSRGGINFLIPVQDVVVYNNRIFA